MARNRDERRQSRRRRPRLQRQCRCPMTTLPERGPAKLRQREDDMSETVSFLYDDHEDARQAVRDLEARVPHDDITIIAKDRDDRHRKLAKAPDVGSGAGTGAGIGAVIGGGAGLLAGLGVLAIPGIGPVVAAGWLAATLAGAAAG